MSAYTMQKEKTIASMSKQSDDQYYPSRNKCDCNGVIDPPNLH